MIDVLADDLKIEETNLQWVFNSFQLPFAADTIGKKQVFLIGASAIIIATLVTGFMKNSTGFFVCRAFAGVGTALLMACNFGILAEYTAPNGRVRSIALAIMLAGQTSGGALAYLVSGPLVEAIGSVVSEAFLGAWRPMFYLVAGLYVLSLIAVIFVARHRVVMDDRKVVDKRIDWVGGLSFTLGAVFLFTSLSQALRESQGWKTPYIIGLLASSVILMSAAVGWARYLEKNTTYPPIMRISVLTRNKGKVAAMLFIVCFCVGGYAGLIYTSNLFYQRFEDMKPSKLMLRFLPARIV
ncbi:hypothetical protein QFC21_003873 [Naganishia friedmannii]|uniref:Uncharacterized protein n=1 Tax=Naganishia friedmannii TaxID=89922 RepID=A0ACC2VL29_9TREE|nr:hypothetical protein QFC21_003873 [Naganishia friedmannii]